MCIAGVSFFKEFNGREETTIHSQKSTERRQSTNNIITEVFQRQYFLCRHVLLLHTLSQANPT
jgi:hypothetical protein